MGWLCESPSDAVREREWTGAEYTEQPRPFQTPQSEAHNHPIQRHGNKGAVSNKAKQHLILTTHWALDVHEFKYISKVSDSTRYINGLLVCISCFTFLLHFRWVSPLITVPPHHGGHWEPWVQSSRPLCQLAEWLVPWGVSSVLTSVWHQFVRQSCQAIILWFRNLFSALNVLGMNDNGWLLLKTLLGTLYTLFWLPIYGLCLYYAGYFPY